MKAFSLIILFISLSAHAAMKLDAKNALDTYMATRLGSSQDAAKMIVGLQNETNARIAEVDKIVKEELPEIQSSTSEMQRQIAEINDDIRYLNDINRDFYSDPAWLKKMRIDTNEFCCKLHRHPHAAIATFYNKLKHSGSSDTSSFDRNNLDGKAGVSRGGRGGGGRGHGGGRGGRGGGG